MSIPVDLKLWAMRHHVSEQALVELSALLGASSVPAQRADHSEAHVQSRVRLAAPALGFRFWRNNVGALKDLRGVPVRYGLANDSKALNERLKSGDLIGWRRFLVEPQHVGQVVAQFASVECKSEGWAYSGDDHEAAQMRWAALVAADGGYARFATGPESLA